jgi:hypothetical protein
MPLQQRSPELEQRSEEQPESKGNNGFVGPFDRNIAIMGASMVFRARGAIFGTLLYGHGRYRRNRDSWQQMIGALIFAASICGIIYGVMAPIMEWLPGSDSRNQYQRPAPDHRP